MNRAIGYKMTHDSGFAPNPFHGYLTLATCKPKVRQARRAGDWVAGFASKELVDRSRKSGLQIPFKGLIYLMRVAESLPLDSYFDDRRFAKKRPTFELGSLMERSGDNIYYRDETGRYRQLRNESHGDGDLHHDTEGKNALVATEFYYFGRNCFAPAEGWTRFLGASLSDGRTFNCPPGFVDKLLGHFSQNGIRPGISGSPCGWGLQLEATDDAPTPTCSPIKSSKAMPQSSTRQIVSRC